MKALIRGLALVVIGYILLIVIGALLKLSWVIIASISVIGLLAACGFILGIGLYQFVKFIIKKVVKAAKET